MAQENSVLFALRDLRTLESDRVAEEARVAAVEAERRRAEEERARAEEEASRLAQRRADEAAAEMARALRETAGRNQQLRSDVEALRALVSAVQAPPPRARSPWPALLVTVAALALAGALWSRRAPTVHERIVYAPAPIVAPPPIVAPAPIVAHPVEPQPLRTARARSKRPAPSTRKLAPVDPSAIQSILDCDGKNPLCGTKL